MFAPILCPLFACPLFGGNFFHLGDLVLGALWCLSFPAAQSSGAGLAKRLKEGERGAPKCGPEWWMASEWRRAN